MLFSLTKGNLSKINLIVLIINCLYFVEQYQHRGSTTTAARRSKKVRYYSCTTCGISERTSVFVGDIEIITTRAVDNPMSLRMIGPSP
ncbi:unnamed protein product, partial [Trichogramma brassicae]